MSGLERSREKLSVFRDPRGSLTLAEFDALPFVPCRAYVLHDIPAGARRGGHAHRSQHRWLAVIEGRVSVVEDDGLSSRRFEIRAGESLHVPPGVWHELESVSDGVLILVLASGVHEPEDYVHERGEMQLVASASAEQTVSASASVSHGSNGRLSSLRDSSRAAGNSSL